MSDSPATNSSQAPRRQWFGRDLDLAAAGAVAGAVITAYLLWWSRGRTSLTDVDTTRVHETASDRNAIVLALLFVLLGFFIALLAKRFAGLTGDLPFVLLVFLPMLIFLIFSGKITNLTAGPTGVALTVSLSKLPPVTDTVVGRGAVVAGTPSAEVADCAEPEEFTNQISQKAVEEPPQAPVATTLGAPVYLKLIMGACPYTMQQVADSLQKNTYNDQFRFVVLVDREDRFRAYMDSLTAAELFACTEYDYVGGPCYAWAYPGLIDAINSDSFAIAEFPGLVLDTVSEDTTNINALKEMKQRGLDALVVTDEGGVIKGVLSQEQILGTMMIELASPTP